MNVELNGRTHEVDDGITVADLVAMLVQPESTGTAVAVDGQVVRRSEWATTPVREDARVEVVRAVQGG